jgi:hypothetical protein
MLALLILFTRTRLIMSLSLVLLSVSIRAQTLEKINISGIINSSSPVPAADCFLKNNEQLGSISDTSGYFRLTFPKALIYDTLVISAMGFERSEVPLSTIDFNQDIVYFYIDRQPIYLGEVLIESERYDPKNLVFKAIANIPNNLPNKRHQLKGLYRKVSTRGSEYTHIEEAAIILEDRGYRKPSESVKIKAQQFRETRDSGEIDSLYVAIFDKMSMGLSQALNKAANPLYRIYESNPVRNYSKAGTYFNFKSFRKHIDEYYKLELVDVYVVNGDTIYQIAFAESVTPPPPKHASGRTYLKINASDFAIVEAQFTRGFKDRPLISQTQVKFEKNDGRYYPKYIKETTPSNINRNLEDDEFDTHTFWFDEVKLRDFERIKPDEVTNPADPRSHKTQTTSSVFWDSTSLIRKYPLDPNVKMDAKTRRALEEQFRASYQN